MYRAFLLVLIWGSTGCQSDCEEVCETAKECGFIEPPFQNANCSDECRASEERSVGCEAQYDAYYGCRADSYEGCTATRSCIAEAEAFEACLAN